jgi:hypothetical protein
VDHRAPDLFLPPPDSVTTIVQGACNTVDACGTGCLPCLPPSGLTVGAASAVRACYGTEPATFCSYECTGGFLKCAGGCCPAASLAAGKANSCVVTTTGGLYCWGDNAQGQVAATADASFDLPQKLQDAGVSTVAVGDAFTCAVVSGAVSCRGSFRSAGAVPSPALSSVVELAAGADHVCARTAAGAVSCWGSNAAGQMGGPGTGSPAVAQPIASGATAISAGSDHTCAIVSGAVRCWGSRAAGQLGDGFATGFSSTPVSVSVANASGSGIGAVAAGATLACAAPSVASGGNVDDALQCWGTGLGSLLAASPQTTPTIPMKSGSQSVVRFQVDHVRAGRAHVCVKRNGVAESIKCFAPNDASNAWGQTGGPNPVIVGEAAIVSGTLNANGFAVGADHGCAILSTGGVQCWGRNSSGQLGDGTVVTPGLGGDARPLGTPVLVRGR